MPAALPIREDLSASELRALARRERKGRVAARMFAIAHALDGVSRAAEQDAETQTVAGLARRFTALVRAAGRTAESNHAAAGLEAWLTEAGSCGITAVQTFAAGLEQDGSAVRAALTLPWSSGQAEGQINRLKLLKRQMYGRASLDLLRRRTLLAARSTQTAQEPPNRGKVRCSSYGSLGQFMAEPSIRIGASNKGAQRVLA